ncbi:MAG: imidazolonepropionase-like amidohydrolase, partial [Polaribacter sp.]
MRYFKYAVIGLAVVWSSAGSADTLVQGGKIISGDRGQSFVADILISGNLITAIGSDISVPEGTLVIDASGKTVTTGLINSYTELGLTEVGAVKQTRDYETNNKRITASLRVSDAINSNSVAIPYNRMLGLTHAVVQPNSKGGLFAGTAAIIKLTDRDTVQQTSVAMVVKLGSHGQRLAGGSRAAAMAMLREAFEDARDYRDNRDSFNKGARRDYPLSRHDLAALIPVLEGRMPLIVHVDRAVDIERVIDFATNNKLNLIIASADEGWRVAEKLAANKVPVIIDPMSNLPSSYDSLGARLDNAK